MGYPIYKLLRAVNRQYPNNGFINYVDVREDIYDTDDPKTDKLIDEDLRDLINEAIQEVYKDVAIDEVYSFPTVPGQNQYVLPEDCDLRDIQEVTRTYQGVRGPLPEPPFPPRPEGIVFATFDANGGTGDMPPMQVIQGTTIILPTCEFEPPEGKTFKDWKDEEDNEYSAGAEYEMNTDVMFSAVWKNQEPQPVWEYDVVFNFNPLYGTVVAPHADLIGDSYALYSVEDGSCVPEVPTVMTDEETEFLGWSLDGETVIPYQTILQTPVTEGITYYGVFENEEEDDDMKSIIEASLADDVTIDSGTGPKVALTSKNNVGSGFSVSNGDIVIGSGISKVKVSGQLTCKLADHGTFDADIMLYSGSATSINRTEVRIEEGEENSNKWHLLTFAPVVIDVQEGDKIYFFTSENIGDKILGETTYNNLTFLTVEEVKVPDVDPAPIFEDPSNPESPVNG